MGEDKLLAERMRSYPFLYNNTYKKQGKGCSRKYMGKSCERIRYY